VFVATKAGKGADAAATKWLDRGASTEDSVSGFLKQRPPGGSN
jgi:hypothetical protein